MTTDTTAWIPCSYGISFDARLFKEIGKRGVIDVLRHGVKHGPHHVTLF
jgi:hypothetical protein